MSTVFKRLCAKTGPFLENQSSTAGFPIANCIAVRLSVFGLRLRRPSTQAESRNPNPSLEALVRTAKGDYAMLYNSPLPPFIARFGLT